MGMMQSYTYNSSFSQNVGNFYKRPQKSLPPKIFACIEINQKNFVGQKFFVTLYPKSEDYGSYRSICPSFNFRSAA